MDQQQIVVSQMMQKLQNYITKINHKCAIVHVDIKIIC